MKELDSVLCLQLVALGACLASRGTLVDARPQDFVETEISVLVARLQKALTETPPAGPIGELKAFLLKRCNCELQPESSAVESIFEQLHVDAAFSKAVRITHEMACGSRVLNKREFITRLRREVEGIEYEEKPPATGKGS